jgi:eukaryotic-like serine/threonine-protein kinase
MGCLDENLVVLFFEGRLSKEESASIDEHLAACSACRRLLATYAAMHPAPAPPPTLLDAHADTEPSDPSDSGDDRTSLASRVARAQAMKRIGTVLCDKWTIDALLGIGGMGHVFAATHRNGRRVAIKMMRPEYAVEPLLVERFLREGYVANRVGHPGAVAILDDDVTPEGAPFLVMELLRGRTLRERLHDQGPLPLAEALRVVGDVLDVLAAAHDKGIVHRDLKPDNLFVTDEGEIKILDFGIARLRDHVAPGVGGTGHTQSGTTLGTLGYMAPEQARGQVSEVDARSDLWSVGATLFMLLTGRHLQEASTTNEALLLAMTTPVPPVATLAPGLPSAICAVLDTALAFEKTRRFLDARSMQGAVRHAAVDPGPTSTVQVWTPRRPSVTRPSWRARALWLAAVAVFALAVGALGGLWRGKSPARSPATSRSPSISAEATEAPPPPSAPPQDPPPSPTPVASSVATTARPPRTPRPAAAPVKTPSQTKPAPPLAPAEPPDPLVSRH